VLQASDRQYRVDDRPARRRGQRQGPTPPDSLHRRHRAGDQWQPAPVLLQEAGDDQVNNLVRSQVHAEDLSHVLRPFNGTHAQHRGGGIGAPVAAVADRHLSPGLIPSPLGVNKYSVKVEHHGPDHVLQYPGRSPVHRNGRPPDAKAVPQPPPAHSSAAAPPG